MALAALAAGSITAAVVGGMATGLNPTQNAATAMSATDAARFLTQATFGPTDTSIANAQTLGVSAWVDQQEAMPISQSMVSFLNGRLAEMHLTNPTIQLHPWDFYDGFWKRAVTAPDQLRKRVALALSEIFVISFQAPGMNTLSIGSYYDMLEKDAFGNYRTLLQDVTLHPTMGNYLNMLGNEKENTITGQLPDQNYAREVQQLMSIGLYQLNQDGTLVTDSSGAPIPTYSTSDIIGLSKVFTGFSWYSTKTTGYGSLVYFYGQQTDPNAGFKAMVAYPAMHSISDKPFLGTDIPASTISDPNGDLKIALDTIFNHPNVGPFIGKQLIQRLVTSNPSPAYVSRVAAVFNNDGTGVRGNLGAVVKAILIDPEARDDTVVSSPTFGKLREPVIRMTNWARAFYAKSQSNNWLIGDTSTPVLLDQATLNSPTVFNFWRPGYSPPGTALGAAGLVAPEFQTVDTVSVAGYLNTMLATIGKGIGITYGNTATPDVYSIYAREAALASNPAALAARVNLLLLYGSMSPGLTTRIVNAVTAVPVPTSGAPAIKAALLNRARLAVFLTMASPEYLAQR